MRIPTSLIVMSVVTSVPFGLAIRDTVKGDRRLTRAERDAQEQRAMEAAYRAQEEAQREQGEQRKAAAIARIPMMFGQKRATLGVFQSIRLGEMPNTTELEDLEDTAVDNMMELRVTTDDNQRVSQISVTLGAEDESVCEQLHDKVVAAWGSPANHSWLAEDRYQRARLVDCELIVEPTLPATEWLARVNRLGLSAANLELAPAVSADAPVVSWRVPGVGYGLGSTEVTAAMRDGKVAYIQAALVTDVDSSLALRDAVSAQLKEKPVRDEDTGNYLWKRAPARMHVREDTGEVFLVIGKEMVE